MMVGPGVFQSVGEKLHGWGTAASEDQKTSGGSAESTDHPKSTLHRVAPYLCSDSDLRKNDAPGEGKC
jgi:hypothetical protein